MIFLVLILGFVCSSFSSFFMYTGMLIFEIFPVSLGKHVSLYPSLLELVLVCSVGFWSLLFCFYMSLGIFWFPIWFLQWYIGYLVVYFRRRQWQPTPVLLPGISHGQRSLVGCSPWGREELDMTEWLRFHFSLSCIGEGNGNPLQCSCLENPRDGGAWWAAVYGVTQSRTRLKWLNSSSSSSIF